MREQKRDKSRKTEQRVRESEHQSEGKRARAREQTFKSLGERERVCERERGK